MQEIPLNGGGEAAKKRVRSYVSRHSKNGELRTKYNPENDSLFIGTLTMIKRVGNDEKRKKVQIPSCLFRFLNKGQATGDELRELAAFSQLLRDKLDRLADEVVVAENEEDLI